MINRVVLLVLVAIFVSPALGSELRARYAARRSFEGVHDNTDHRELVVPMPLVIDEDVLNEKILVACGASDIWCAYKGYIIGACVGVGFLLVVVLGAVKVYFNSKKLRGQAKVEKVEPKKKSEPGIDSSLIGPDEILQILQFLGESLDVTDQGLFRIPGGDANVRELFEKINNHMVIDYSKVLNDDKCSAIKIILKQLHILTDVDLNQTLNTVLNDLDQHKRLVFEWVLNLCCDIADNYKVNQMDPENVGFCVGPSLAPEQYGDNWVHAKGFLTSAIKICAKDPARIRTHTQPVVFYYQY